MFTKSLIIIVGSTGVGKSEFAIDLALKCNGEIVNGDLGQFYTPLSIGTAKPNLKIQKVPHHLFNIFDEPVNYTVAAYAKDVLRIASEIWARGKTPIIVGGSTFYMSSLFFPPFDFKTSEISQNTQKIIESATWQTLYQIDPVRAHEINRHDIYRIKRAMTIWYQTGKKPSTFKPKFDPLSSSYFISLSRDRSELNTRINKRTREMLDHGWIDEAASLLGTKWQSFVKEKGFIGYEEIFTYLESSRSKRDFEKLLSKIQQQTRFYAKRQMTFWRMLERRLRSSIE